VAAVVCKPAQPIAQDDSIEAKVCAQHPPLRPKQGEERRALSNPVGGAGVGVVVPREVPRIAVSQAGREATRTRIPGICFGCKREANMNVLDNMRTQQQSE
jgi:hypothetical protein